MRRERRDDNAFGAESEALNYNNLKSEPFLELHVAVAIGTDKKLRFLVTSVWYPQLWRRRLDINEAVQFCPLE